MMAPDAEQRAAKKMTAGTGPRSKKEIDDMLRRLQSASADAQDSGATGWYHYYESLIEALNWVNGDDSVDLIQMR